MHDTVKNLPELMRRATEELETDSIDLVRRGMLMGARLRRRRTAGLSLVAAGAVLVTAASVVAAQSIGPDQSDAPFAGNPTPSAPASKRTVNPVTTDPKSKDTLATLRRVVPTQFRVTDPMHWGGVGFNAASIDVDEGKGRSELGVILERRADYLKACPAAASAHGRCKVLDDGSVLIWHELEPVYPRYPRSSKYPTGKHPGDLGVKYNSIDLHRRDGVIISMQSYTSAEEKRSPKTRDRPPFSIAQLTSMAQSKLWQPPSTAMPTYTKPK